MKARIHNVNVDVEIEGDHEKDILEEFYRDYPSEINNVIFIEWDRSPEEEEYVKRMFE